MKVARHYVDHVVVLWSIFSAGRAHQRHSRSQLATWALLGSWTVWRCHRFHSDAHHIEKAA